MIAELFTRDWWLLWARGMAAGILGALVLVWPHLSLVTLVSLFGVYALVDGLSTLIGASLQRTRCADWRLIGVQGLAGIAIGVIVFTHPGMTASYLAIQIALRTVAVGGIDGIAGLVLLEETRSEWLLLLSSAVPALFAVLVFAALGPGLLAARWYLVITSIIASVLFTALAFRLRTRRVRLIRGVRSS